VGGQDTIMVHLMPEPYHEVFRIVAADVGLQGRDAKALKEVAGHHGC
jgi:hypothetical protein